MTASDHLGPQFVNAFHAAPRFVRKAIEEKGIVPSSNSLDDAETPEWDRVFPSAHTQGAFFFQNKYDLEHYIGAGSRDSDIWHGTVPLEDTHQDPYLEDADYTTKPIKNVSRVGHAADDGIHWHPEEKCPRCK
jgi:hypothetical protein